MSGHRGLEYSNKDSEGDRAEGGVDRPSGGDDLSSDPSGRQVILAANLGNILDAAEDLLLSKHHDYGPDNIMKSPFGPLFGLLVRLHDKQARAVNLVSIGEDANYESLEDTFFDMLNYSAIAILVLRNQWK